MGSHDRLRVEASASVTRHDVGRSHFLQHAARQTGLLIASMLAGIAVGVVYRLLLDPPAEREDLHRVRGRGWARRCGDCRSRAKSSFELWLWPRW
jgi:hypothetical protein